MLAHLFQKGLRELVCHAWKCYVVLHAIHCVLELIKFAG